MRGRIPYTKERIQNKQEYTKSLKIGTLERRLSLEFDLI